MTEYTVTWRIQLYTGTPRMAAMEALAIMRDRGLSAVVFEVQKGDSEPVIVDLDEAVDVIRWGDKEFEVPEGFVRKEWADVLPGDEVFVCGTDNGKPRAYGPHEFVSRKGRTAKLRNTSRGGDFLDTSDATIVRARE